MKNQLHTIGFGFILFGILLAVLASADPWIPLLGNIAFALLVLALLSGVLGLMLLFQKDHSDK